MMDSPLTRVNSTLSFDHFRDKPDIRERRWAGKTDFEKFACASAPKRPRMRTNAHRQLLPASPGDSVPSPAQCGPLSAISYLSSPARLTPRPGTTGSTVSRYENSPDWTYEDFERQVIKNLNLTLAARPWTDASYRSPRQYAVAKTWGVDGSTGTGSPVLREENIAKELAKSSSTILLARSAPTSPDGDFSSPQSQVSPGALSRKSTPSQVAASPRDVRRRVWTTDIIATRTIKSAPW